MSEDEEIAILRTLFADPAPNLSRDAAKLRAEGALGDVLDVVRRGLWVLDEWVRRSIATAFVQHRAGYYAAANGSAFRALWPIDLRPEEPALPLPPTEDLTVEDLKAELENLRNLQVKP